MKNKKLYKDKERNHHMWWYSLLKSGRLWTPLVTGYTASAICGVPRDAGSVLPQRPPAYVFRIIWPVLYLLLGFSWSVSKTVGVVDALHGVCTGLLVLWLLMYSCANKKQASMYVIATTLAVIMACMALAAANGNPVSVIALTPLWAWLFVAFHLNWHLLDH